MPFPLPLPAALIANGDLTPQMPTILHGDLQNK